MKNKEVFDTLIRTCAGDFLRSSGLESTPNNDADAPMEDAAVIGFSGHDVRGVVGLGMQRATLQQLAMPPQDPARGEPLLEDWLSEAANQLLGRLKNKLLGYGTVVSIALPMVLRGVRLQFVANSGAGPWTYTFDTAAGRVCVWLDVRVRTGFELIETSDPESKSIAEGELMLF